MKKARLTAVPRLFTVDPDLMERLMFSIPELQQLSPPQYVWDISCVVQIVTGLLFCFVGYRIFKLVLGIVGFAAGAIIGTLAGFDNYPEP